jgi:hypothetical protein
MFTKLISAFAIAATFIASTVTAKILPTVDVQTNNESVREAFTKTFQEAGLHEFVSIARCESGLVHYVNEQMNKNPDSNARGILQLMTSMHPDPVRVNQYNSRFGTSYSASDFNLLDPEEYIQYALLLATIRGTRDWVASRRCWG